MGRTAGHLALGIGKAAGATLTTLADGQSVGAITSLVRSPALDRPIALGYVRRQVAEPDTELVATDGERQLSCVVTRRPFLPLPNAVQDV